jgi:hypothetical protein
MAEVFHWIIFAFHLAAALGITFGVWWRCDPSLWVTRLYVDTYTPQENSIGLWLDRRDPTDVERCYSQNASGTRSCFEADLPLYEKSSQYLGWQLFALLGNFEWISASFAFFYIVGSWNQSSYIISSAMAAVGTLMFMPFRGPVFLNQVFLQLINGGIAIFIFYKYRKVHGNFTASKGITAAAVLGGEGNLVPSLMKHADLPALRFCEYCITASELWVAVFSVYVQDAPAFMSIGGYTLIFLTNLYGVLLHYSLVSDNAEGKLESPVVALPKQASMRTVRVVRRGLRVPLSMLGKQGSVSGSLEVLMNNRRVWGSYISSNVSTLLNSWLAYLVAMGFIFYQQNYLVSKEPPAFVVAAGWSLILSFTSFGLWMTFIYWYPDLTKKLCSCLGTSETYDIALYGLDVLSLSSKLSIVMSLSYGFIFRAEGKCN